MSIEVNLMLFFAGLVAGGINAIAGGATLLTFPVLMAAGLPPTVANASNFVAVLPGNAAAIPAYARELGGNRQEALVMMAGAAVGGYGAARYARLVPQGLLHGCVIFLGFALSIYYFLK